MEEECLWVFVSRFFSKYMFAFRVLFALLRFVSVFGCTFVA
jgi:hypothetical protein